MYRKLMKLVCAAGLASSGVALAAGPIRARGEVPLPAVTASQDPAVIDAGRYIVYGPGRCSQCHGAYERTNPAGNTSEVPLAGGFLFELGPMGEVWGANLTSHPTTGLGSHTDGEIARAIQHAVRRDGTLAALMVFDAADLDDTDLTAVVSFLRSLPPADNAVSGDELTGMGRLLFKMIGVAPDLAPAPAGVRPSAQPSVERGRYLAESVAGCVLCHSGYTMKGGFQSVPPLAGGAAPDKDVADPSKVFVAPNLTSDPTGRTGAWTEDAFVARFAEGRTHPTSKMAWENFARMTDADLRSIYRYLRSLPPAQNDVGPTWRDAKWKPAKG